LVTILRQNLREERLNLDVWVKELIVYPRFLDVPRSGVFFGIRNVLYEDGRKFRGDEGGKVQMNINK
jgi:hypothetical protein